MKQSVVLRGLFFACLLFASTVQGELFEWTWVNGPNTVRDPGTYGELNVAAPGNVPAARAYGATWTGSDGRFWVFGGSNSTGINGLLNDLWVYDPKADLWTWKGGSPEPSLQGVYGIRGEPSATNLPGGRQNAATWIDRDGRLWLFGGYGRDSAGARGWLNDLWRYDPSTNQWTWIKGSNVVDRRGVYGTRGVPAALSTPGARGGAVVWRDAQDRIWLFGGYGYTHEWDGYLADLWRYDPATDLWVWIKGSNEANAKTVYGQQGTGTSLTAPGARTRAGGWLDAQGRLWLFGGFGYGAIQQGTLNDVWRFDPASGIWTWVKGSSAINQGGTYGEQGVGAPANTPGARDSMATWTDAQGRFWLYGGLGYVETGGIGKPALWDLWRYEPATNLWTSVHGGANGGQSARYGTKGVSTDRTKPGSKWNSHSWLDERGRLWIFGGNSYSESYGSDVQNDLWRYDIEPVPVAIARAASEITDRSAVLSGTLNANGESATASFRFGTQSSLQQFTEGSLPAVEADSATHPVAREISGLLPGTTYYFQLVATNAAGTGFSEIRAFKTAATPAVRPGVTSVAASSIGKTEATLNGLIEAKGMETVAGFEWGTTPELGSFTGYSPAGAGTAPQSITHVLSGLAPGTTYYFRARGENAGSFPVRGEVLSFQTYAPVITNPAANVSFTTGTFHAQVDPEGVSGTSYFEYGDTPQLGSSTAAVSHPAGAEVLRPSVEVAGLLPDTTYYFRAVLVNAIGHQFGEVLQFKTGVARAPSSQTVGIGGVTAREVTLRGTVTASGLQTVGYFEMGEAGLSETTLGQLFGAEDLEKPYEIVVSGLRPHTRYEYRAVATNPLGMGTGETLSFTTANTVPVGVDKNVHAPAVGASAVVYRATDGSDGDGDPLTLAVEQYEGSGNVTTTGSEIVYAGGGFVGSETLQVRISDGFGGSTVATVTLHNAAPAAGADSFQVGATGAVLEVLSNDTDADQDALVIAALSEAAGGTLSHDGQRITYTPGTGFRGYDQFSYTVSDQHGGSAVGSVTVMANHSVAQTLAMKDEAAPGSEGAVWSRFGAPSIFEQGREAGWLATIKAGKQQEQGIYSGPIGAPVLRVRAGDRARDAAGQPIAGSQFRSFKDPVFAGRSFAFLARVSGSGITPAGDTGLWIGNDDSLREIAREGSDAPGTNGAKFQAFTSVAMPGSDAVFFTAKLKTGRGGVSRNSSNGLWVWTPGGTRLVLRNGQGVDFGSGTLRVRSFKVFSAVAGSAGHGRYDAHEQSVDVLVSFSDGAMAVLRSGTDAGLSLVAPTGQTDESGRRPVQIGLPSSPGNGAAPVALVTFQTGPGGITKANSVAVWDFAEDQILAQSGAPAPGITEGSFKSIQDPVTGYGFGEGQVTAFMASVRGATKAEDTGVWVHTAGESSSLELLAREGSEPPGAPGTRWKKFESVSVMEGRGVVFTGKLASGSAAVTGSNDRGVWVTTTAGELQLVLREGDQIGSKTLRSFSVLHTVAGSPGQRRAWTIDDPAGTLVYLAYFSDGSSGIHTVSIP